MTNRIFEFANTELDPTKLNVINYYKCDVYSGQVLQVRCVLWTSTTSTMCTMDKYYKYDVYCGQVLQVEDC